MKKTKLSETLQERKRELMEQILEYFEQNTEAFENCVEELDSYNGYLGSARYYDMDALDELECGAKPLEIAYRCYYGHDEDTGEEFNPLSRYVRFEDEGYVSADYKDYSEYLDMETVEELCNVLYEDRQQMYPVFDNEELATLFRKMDEIYEEAESEK